MRFLKKKIALAMGFNAHQVQEHQRNTKAAQKDQEEVSLKKKRLRIPGHSYTSEASRATKNIVKNYGRSICSFALSHLAIPYLERILKKEDLSLEEFTRYIKEIKGSIDGLMHFRSFILIGKNDAQSLAASKRAFIAISEVFIKFFSVNWIYNSRVFHKEAHLDFRFKILRRIQHPEHFTYLTETKKNLKSQKKKSSDF